MNVGEASAVNTVVRALAGIPEPFTGQLPSLEEQQAAVDLLVRGAYKRLSAGLMPGDVVLGETS